MPKNKLDDLRQLATDDHCALQNKNSQALNYPDLNFNLARSLFDLIQFLVMNDAKNSDDKQKTTVNNLFYLSIIVGQIAKHYQKEKDINDTLEFQSEIQAQMNNQITELSYYCPLECSSNHQLSQHKESHNRIKAVRDTLQTIGLMQEAKTTMTISVQSWPHYTQKCRDNMNQLLFTPKLKASTLFPKFENLIDNDLPVTDNTVYAINAALSSTEDAAQKTLENIKKGKSEKIFCAIRPPGHHAHPDHPEGFCFANSMIQAAGTLMNAGKKIMIIDIDAHHGNGTYEHLKRVNLEQQHLYKMIDIFSEDSYMNSDYMQTRITESKNENYRDKIHLHPMKEDEYTGDNVLKKIEKSIGDFKEQGFEPDVIIVSAGFDAASVEEYHGQLCPYDFGRIGQFISSKANHVISLLEGGYKHQERFNHSLQRCVFYYIAGTAHCLPESDAPFPMCSLKNTHDALNYIFKSIIPQFDNHSLNKKNKK